MYQSNLFAILQSGIKWIEHFVSHYLNCDNCDAYSDTNTGQDIQIDSRAMNTTMHIFPYVTSINSISSFHASL